MRRQTGRLVETSVAGDRAEAFVPHPLPPVEPPLVLDEKLRESLRAARRALVRLELAGEMVPSLDWFIYAFVRKEAVVSSQIEGTQSTLVDLLDLEAGAEDLDEDLEEVCNYLDALDFARQQLADPRGLPLSRRLLDGAHGILMRGVRGGDKQPGQLRRSQNWIGGTGPRDASFVPPPPHLLPDLLGELEQFIHDDRTDLEPLLRIGLVHVQFETLHPYLDGNGRIGRLLITLLLEQWQLLSQPLLYLSLFLKRHRGEYYRRLDAVRDEGDWEGWLEFFLTGVATIAAEAAETARALSARVRQDRERLLASPSATVTGQRLFELLPEHPILTTNRTMNLLGTSRPTALKALSVLEAAGVLDETTGRHRDRRYVYSAYLERLREGTEPIP